jgi:alcohol/geraniol dehydrogenase (NADP+)
MSFRAYAQLASGRPLELVSLSHAAPLGSTEVEIAVEHSAVCRSDVHLLDGDWGNVRRPLVPGHEIVGRIVDAGGETSLPIGTRVGLGWQAGACGECLACRTAREHLCTGGKVRTCVGRTGGFAERVRCTERFAFALPAGIDPASAPPLLCAGLTVFSPLERFAAGPSIRVGVVGLGGLGHLAVAFAHALGASVVAFDPDATKRPLALALGASDLVDPGEGSALPEAAVDLLLVTTHATLDLDRWLRVLDLEGTLCLVGIPSRALTVPFDPLLDEQKKVTGSVIGSPRTMREMLVFAAANGIAPIVERMPIGAVNEAITRVREGRARMRIVLDIGF